MGFEHLKINPMNHNLCASEHGLDRGIGYISVEGTIVSFTIKVSKSATLSWD